MCYSQGSLNFKQIHFAQHYKLIAPLGQGGMGKVFEAEDLRFPGRRIALKQLNESDPIWVATFRQEFSLLAASQHPNILDVYEFGRDEETGISFYTAELIRGESLAHRRLSWSERELIEVLLHIGRALRFLGSRSIIHGDIKPGNILWDARNEEYRLVDFGLARTRTGRDVHGQSGTPLYMAPEIWEGNRADSRSDLFSLGVTIERLASHTDPPTALRSSLRTVITRMTEKNPDARFRDADALLENLCRTVDPSLAKETEATLNAYSVSPRLSGRQEVLTEIAQELREGRSPVVVTGAPGMGKSRLLVEICRRFQLEGISTTLIHCQLHQAFADQIGHAISEQEHLLVLDDVEFLPEKDQELLLEVVRRIGREKKEKFSILFSTEQIEHAQEFPGLKHHLLKPFSSEEVHDYMESLGVEVHPEVLRVLVRLSGGVPLLLESMVRDGLPNVEMFSKVEAAEELNKLHPPKDYERIWSERIFTLSSDERRLLEFLAIADAPLPINYGVDDSRQSARLMSLHLARGAILGNRSACVIESPAVAELALKNLSSADLRNRHREVADLFEGVLSSEAGRPLELITQVAVHRSLSGDLTQASPFLAEALGQFLKSHANDEGILMLRRIPIEGHWSGSARSTAAELWARVGEYDRAFEQLIQLQKEKGESKAIILRRMADLQLKRRKFKEALEQVTEAENEISALEENQRKEERVHLLLVRQTIALLQGGYPLVEATGREIEKKAPEGMVRERASSLCMRGHAAQMEGRLQEAGKKFRAALQLGEESKNLSAQSMAWGNLGKLAQHESRFADAEKDFRKAMEFAEKARDYLALATLQMNVSALCQKIGKYREACDSIERSVEIYRRLGNHEEFALALYTRASLRFSLFGSDTAVTDDVQNALELAEAAGNEDAAAYAHLLLARVSKNSASRSHWDTARRSFRKRMDSSGLREAALVALEEHFAPETKELEIDEMDLEQRLRFAAWKFVEGKGSQEGELLSPVLRKMADKNPNPELLAQFLSLQVQFKKGQPRDPMAASQAILIFEGLSASLGEEDQEAYLSVRRVDDLKKLVTEDDELPGSPSVIHAEVDEKATIQDYRKNSLSEEDLITTRAGRELPANSLGRLLGMIKLLNDEIEFQKTVDLLLDFAVAETKAERGFFVTEEGDDFRVVSARNMKQLWIREPNSRFSRTAVKKALRSGATITEGDVAESKSWKNSPSLVNQEVRSFLAVPLRSQEKIMGVIYLDRRKSPKAFSSTEVLIVEALAEQGSTALRKNELMSELKIQAERIAQFNGKLEDELESKETQIQQTETLLQKTGSEDSIFHRHAQIIAKSDRMRNILRTVETIAASRSYCYISGESGTGKELIAQALHERSPQARGPWVPVQCGSIPEDLFDALFFGHEKGAFTGADKARVGFFVAANGGTLFLDEIDQLKPDQQAKLLRALQESKVLPVGKTAEVSFSIRVVTASNRDLEKLRAAGDFREDLFYRLHVIRIDLPPLRERIEDIPLLIHHFLKMSALTQKYPLTVADNALEALMRYRWPGNIRELKNEMDRIVALLPLSSGGKRRIKLEDLSPVIRGGSMGEAISDDEPFHEAIDRFTAQRILLVLKKTKGNRTKAAQLVGMHRNGFNRMLQRLKIKVLPRSAYD